jgi:hypothetical protein
MAGKSPVYIAIVLIIAAGITNLTKTQGRDIIEVETRKIVTEGDSSRPASAGERENRRRSMTERSPRVLFITAKGCDRCEEELNRLRKSGGDFQTMKALGWKIGPEPTNHIQIVDRDDVPDLVLLLRVREYPTVACIVDGEIVRSFKDGCTTPLDAWTFGWLIKGQNERPRPAISEIARVETTGNYRLRGNHWSLEGDPNPTKQAVLNHLRGPNHGHASVAHGAIENWSYEELRSLHDDLHEQEGGTYGVYGQQQFQPQAANRSLDAFSGNRKVTGR